MNYPSSIIGLVNEFGIKADKRYGQCFLIENNILDQIAACASLAKSDLVIEIGSGPANLTSRLSALSGHVIAFETDRAFFPVYERYFSGSNVDFHMADFLKADVEGIIEKARAAAPGLKGIKVVANIPYYITSPIIEKLLYSNINFEAVYLLMQKDVADRIMSSHGSRDYGLLSICCAFAAEVSLVRKIGKNCFFPKPDVESALLKFVPLKRRSFEEFESYVFFSILKAAFNQRRKVVFNAIANNVERISKIQKYPEKYCEFAGSEGFTLALSGALETCGISRQARAEEIPVEAYILIARFVSGAFRAASR